MADHDRRIEVRIGVKRSKNYNTAYADLLETFGVAPQLTETEIHERKAEIMKKLAKECEAMVEDILAGKFKMETGRNAL